MKTLTPELKAYYMADFVDNVLECKDEFWKLDEGLKDLLVKINVRDNIQTLYSRKRTYVNDKNRTSFLWILISKDVTNAKMNNFIADARKKLPDFECVFAKDIVQNRDMNIKMDCINDPKYFENGAIMISLTTPVQFNHERFWSIIEKHLTTF
jgi:hypothetical protein